MPSTPPEPEHRSLHALPPGTVLHDYVIDSELGSGGFSVVYLARHRLNSDWLTRRTGGSVLPDVGNLRGGDSP